MQKDCRSALIAMTGAIGLAAAIIAVGVSAGTIMSGDNGYRMLKTIPIAEPQTHEFRNEFGRPNLAPYLSNRS